MNVLLLLALPLIGAFLSGILSCFAKRLVPYFAVLVIVSSAIVLGCIGSGGWIAEFKQPWISTLGAHFHLALDGMALIFIALLYVTGLSTIYISVRNNRASHASYYVLLLLLIACMTGVFLAVDLLLFFIFFELMLFPLYFYVILWGGQRKTFAAIQFLLFTQASGLFLLIGILTLYFNAHTLTGIYSFDSVWLRTIKLPEWIEVICALGFSLAFLVKLPVVPFHAWIPSLFKESPLPVLMVGIMVKTGVYGFLRFVLPLFPVGVWQLAPLMMSLGIITIFYGAFAAFRKNDVREVLAYIVLSHMGLILLGIFSGNSISSSGIILLVVSEAICIIALLMLFHEKEFSPLQFDIEKMGGFLQLPRLSLCAFALVLASMGLPLFGNFIGEVLVLMGIFSVNKFAAGLSLVGMICLSAVYLWFLYRVFFGKNDNASLMPDMKKRSLSVYCVLIAMLLMCGLAPNVVTDLVKKTGEAHD